MTENQWPQTPDTAATDPYGAATVEDGYSTPAGTDTAGGSKTETAKQEASNVAGQAASAAQNVAQTAKEEVANVAAEAKSSAQDLFGQAKQGLSSQAGSQQQKAAEGIRTISSQLHDMASAPDQQGVASDLIRQAAQRSESVASWLENRQPGDLLDEVQRFARNKPGTFLLLAAGAGVLGELRVDPHPVPLRGTQRRPIPLRVVGDEDRADDPDAVGVGVAARFPRALPPGIENDPP